MLWEWICKKVLILENICNIWKNIKTLFCNSKFSILFYRTEPGMNIKCEKPWSNFTIFLFFTSSLPIVSHSPPPLLSSLPLLRLFLWHRSTKTTTTWSESNQHSLCFTTAIRVLHKHEHPKASRQPAAVATGNRGRFVCLVQPNPLRQRAALWDISLTAGRGLSGIFNIQLTSRSRADRLLLHLLFICWKKFSPKRHFYEVRQEPDLKWYSSLPDGWVGGGLQCGCQ